MLISIRPCTKQMCPGHALVQMLPPDPVPSRLPMGNMEPAPTTGATPVQALSPPELMATDAAAVAAAERFAQGVSDIHTRRQRGGLAQPMDIQSQQMDLQGALAAAAASAEGLEVEASGWSGQWEGPPSGSNQPTFLGERLKRLSRSANSLIVSIEDAVMSMPFDDLLQPADDAQHLLVEAMAWHRERQQRQGAQRCRYGGAAGGIGQGGGAQAVPTQDQAPGSDPFMPSEPAAGVSAPPLTARGGLARLSSAVGLSHAQLSSMVGPDFNWDVYNSVFTSSSSEEGGCGDSVSSLDAAPRPASSEAMHTAASPRFESPPEVANDSLWARIIREAAATVEHTDTGVRLHPAAAELQSEVAGREPQAGAGLGDAYLRR